MAPKLPQNVISQTRKSTLVDNPCVDGFGASTQHHYRRWNPRSNCIELNYLTSTLDGPEVDHSFQVLPQLSQRDTLRYDMSHGQVTVRIGWVNFYSPMRFMNCAGIVSLLLLSYFSSAAFAQNRRNGEELGVPQASQTSQAGAGALGTQATPIGQADGTGNPTLGGRRPLYRLNGSDVVTLSFTLSPEFDQTLTIQPDGYITLKEAGAVFAQGLTLEELRQAVCKAYTGYLHDPEVAVALKDFEHPYFIAGGEVGRPGKYELRADITVAEAVEIAGGFTHQAKHSQVLLFRRVNDELIEAHAFNLKSVLKGKKLGEIADLRPGDLIFVPQNAISKIQPFISRPSLSMYLSSSQF
jgi:polysaccharide biosynthesis/export protein